MESFKRYFAEFFGTLVLVLFACGTAVVLGCGKGQADAAYFLTALAFGLTLCALVYVIGPVSGCHVNPAVSLALWMEKKIKFWDFLAYVVAQFAGAIAGSAVLSYFVGTDHLGENSLYTPIHAPDAVKSVLIEMILTCLFVLTILCVTAKAENGAVSGIVIGLSLTLVHVFGIHFTGTSVNPARSFGPALILGGEALKDVWVFILGPVLGAILAVAIHTLLTMAKKKRAVPADGEKPVPVKAPEKPESKKSEPKKASSETPSAPEKEAEKAPEKQTPPAQKAQKSAPKKRSGAKTEKNA